MREFLLKGNGMRNCLVPGSVGIKRTKRRGDTTWANYTVKYTIQNVLRLLIVGKGIRGKTMNWYLNIRFDFLAVWVHIPFIIVVMCVYQDLCFFDPYTYILFTYVLYLKVFEFDQPILFIFHGFDLGIRFITWKIRGPAGSPYVHQSCRQVDIMDLI